MAKITGPLTMPENHAAMIGRIAEGWALLEFQIDRGIWTLLATPQQLAACLTAQMISVHPRMKAFIALVEVRGGSESTINALKKFYGDVLSPLSERRNRAVHDPRMTDKATGKMHRFEVTAKPKTHFGFKPEPIELLQEFHSKIHETIGTLTKMRDKTIREIEALPPESQPQLVSILEVVPSPSDPKGV